MSQKAKRHHFIPQFWIKRWADENGFVKRYRRFGSYVDVRTEPPKSVGYFHNLYELPVGLRTNHSLEESFFKPLDDRASKVFNVMDQEGDHTLSREQAVTLGVFILSLLNRTPEGLNSIREAANAEYQSALSEACEKFDADVVKAFEAAQPDNAPDIAFYRNFVKLMTSENLVGFISRMHWRILYRDTDTHPLLLSDDPLARTNGFRRPGGHFAFPLSPDKMAMAFYEEKLAEETLLVPAKILFDELNAQTVGAARHFVVAKTEKHTRFIRNRFGRDLRPPFGEQMRRQR